MAKDSTKATPPQSPTPGTARSQSQPQQQRQQGSAVLGASLLIILQVASRAATLIANQFLLRFLTATLLGLSTQLEVYHLSVLFFARESLRVAIQRQNSGTSPSDIDGAPKAEPTVQRSAGGGEKSRAKMTMIGPGHTVESQSLINLAHLSFVPGLASALLFGTVYLRTLSSDSYKNTPYLSTSVFIYALAALAELLAEPSFVVLQHRLHFRPRATAESAATVVKCGATLGAAAWARYRSEAWGVLPFAIGQMAYGIVIAAVYTWFGARLARDEGFTLFPRRIGVANRNEQEGKGRYSMGYFYAPTLQLARSLMAQSVLKHFLTQGDTFLVSILSSAEAQGVYAVANNYGSLLARFVFQPVEESSRSYFSKLLSTSSPDPIPGQDDSETFRKLEPKLEPKHTIPAPQLQESRTSLLTILHIYLILALPLLTLGPPASPAIIRLLAGPSWAASGAGTALASYCLFLPLLALNGLLEAFVSSVASTSDLAAQSRAMAAFTVVFAAAGYVGLTALNLGARGLVLANAANMACRIAWCGRFITGWFQERGAGEVGWVKEALPNGLAVAVAGTAVVWRVLGVWCVDLGIGGKDKGVKGNKEALKDLVAVAVVGVGYLLPILYMERHFLLRCYRSFRGA